MTKHCIERFWHLADAVRAGWPIPAGELRELAAEAILDNAQPPPRRKGRLQRYDFGRLRRSVICGAIEDVVKTGLLKRTRNDASEPLSACDAVVEAALAFGVTLTYDQVRKLTERARGTRRITGVP